MKLAESLAKRQNAMTVGEVAEVLQISERLVYQMAAEGRIPSFKIRGTVRFDAHILSQWITGLVDGSNPSVRTLVPKCYGDDDENEMEAVCQQAYQLIGALGDIVPNLTKWLDNLAEGRLVHKGLLPVFHTQEEWNAFIRRCPEPSQGADDAGRGGPAEGQQAEGE